MRSAKTKPKFSKNQKDSRVTEVYRYSDFLAPRFWTTWLAIAGLHLLAWLPWRLKIGFARLLCVVIRRFVKSRYNTVVANIRACFPDLSPEKQSQLIDDALFSNAFGLIETAHAWVRGVDGLNIELEGWENYEAAKKDGRGILVFSCHFSMLDLGAAMLGDKIPVGTIYRKHDNPLFNYFMTRSREKFVNFTIARKDVKEMMRRLRSGDNLAYLPDQDFGPKRSIFVPFFGVPAATITMTSQLAKAGNALVLPISAHRVGNTPNYVMTIHPILDIPSGDDIADTLTWVQWLEGCVREHPEQYLWFHKRFKTRPEGEPSIY